MPKIHAFNLYMLCLLNQLPDLSQLGPQHEGMAFLNVVLSYRFITRKQKTGKIYQEMDN